MDTFDYKKSAGLTALTASIAEFRYTKHCHEEYAVGVTLRGSQQFHLDGSLLTSRPGEAMLFNPGQVHDGMSREKTGIDYVMLYIDPELLCAASGIKEPVRFSAPVVNDPALRRRILSLVRAVSGGREDALCSELLLGFAEHVAGPPGSAAHAKNSALVCRVEDMIRGDVDRDQALKLADICLEIHVPKYTLIRMFKASTGISPYQFYLNCKVEKAKQIIQHRKDVYLAVAECGFVDLSHLNRNFKSRYGVTAYEYLTGIQ